MEHTNYWCRPDAEKDPFGFGAAAQKQINEGTVDGMRIPGVLPEDANLPPYEA